jgi:hypothetical protein
MLELLFQEGRIIWLILILVAIEAVILSLWLSRTQRAQHLPGVLANLAAGACLMTAIGSVLAGWGVATLALLLALSLVAHVFDLWLRLRP